MTSSPPASACEVPTSGSCRRGEAPSRDPFRHAAIPRMLPYPKSDSAIAADSRSIRVCLIQSPQGLI